MKGIEATLSWSRIDDNTVVGKLECADPKGKNLGVWLEFYAPWLYETVYEVEGKKVFAKGSEFTLTTDVEASHVLPLQFMNKSRYVENQLKDGKIKKEDASLSLIFQNTSVVRFALSNQEKIPALSGVDDLLEEKKTLLIESGKEIAKDNLEVYEAVTNNINWMITYNSEKDYLYVPSGRTWVTNLWTMHEWDSFFNALSLNLESPEMAKQEILAVLNTAYEETGHIPNVRDGLTGSADRSQPPVGSYVVWKIYEKTKDKAFLEKVYPALEAWRNYWTAEVSTGFPRRDGNRDGLLEWGSDLDKPYNGQPGIKLARWESGMDDLPLWDDALYVDSTWTMNLNALDFNCLFAWDAEHLAKIATELGLKKQAKNYLKSYEQTKALINERLWNEEEGFYYDQFWNGELSTRKAASNFYVLLAGIAPEGRAKRILSHLTNESEFWGDYVIPTISKDDKAYDEQQYWRGTIWPPTNYLVYQGLKRYGFDQVAKEYAEKSTNLFLKHYRNGGGCPENFDSKTGKFGGQRYQSWGVLYPLLMLEELGIK
ncbi:MAG: hypothetical protein HRT61_09125 [Ekhidna sp.]|nr:hypothetical protein [Ekhidna sp.]